MIVYSATDSGAPVLSGTAGALIALLDACLVNGYGSKAAAGWSKPFTGTNKAVFRAGTGGNQRYLDVDDSTTTYAQIRGYNTMTAVGVGTEAFPTATQVAIGSGPYVNKSAVANSTARNWLLLATSKYFILWLLEDAAPGSYSSSKPGTVFIFGDISSNKVGDAYSSILIANSNNTYTGNTFASISNIGASVGMHYMERSYTGLGTSIPIGKHTDAIKALGSSMGTSGRVFPDPVTGGILLAPVWIHESANSNVRGILPGVWAHLHTPPTISMGDTFNGAGLLAGKTFIMLSIGAGSTVFSCAFEISDTWG